jgi:hypothetical protein
MQTTNPTIKEITNLISELSEADQAALLKEQPHNSQSPIFCLEQLAKTGAFTGIENPVEWQRQLRQDRQFLR